MFSARIDRAAKTRMHVKGWMRRNAGRIQ